MAGGMVYRLRVGDLAEPHMTAFAEAMRVIEGIWDNRGYNDIAGFHGAPGWYCWHHQSNPRTPMRSQVFLPWHRAYLLHLELALNDQLPGVTIPWWEWTSQPEVPPAFWATEFEQGDNPLAGSRAWVPQANPPIDQFTQRAPGSNPQVWLPVDDEVAAVLDDPDWFSFSDRLENLHDNVHVWVGGDMTNQATAAYDPLFFAHHCMIDRLWYLWQVRYGNGGIPGPLLDLELVPFGRRVRDVLDVQALGYEYAMASTQIAMR